MNELIQLNASGVSGKKYWRSLDELSNTPQFRQWVEREFQEGASEMLQGGSRRSLLKLMAAGFGLAGLTACRRPEEKILPHAKGVEDYVPGRPLHYATVATMSGAATGLIVECNEGRPTKVEGNARHPYSLGTTNAHLQALVLNLYDPDRKKSVSRKGVKSSWDEFGAWWKTEATKLGDGAGLRILSERTASPAVIAQKAEVLKKYPKAQWVEFDSVNYDEARLGAQMAFGQPLETHYLYDQADVIFSLDSDFLGLDSPTVQPLKQFSKKRRVSDPKDEMNRLYVAESNFTMTGAMADNRLRVKSTEAGALAVSLAFELNVGNTPFKVLTAVETDKGKKFISAVAKDLAAHKGKSIVVAGPRQPAAVHAVVALINQALGNVGTTVVYTKPVADVTDSVAAVKQLTAEMQSGAVKTLFVLGGNPAYSMPADLGFADACKKATVVALTADENETHAAAEWQLPEAHVFESWGDARALDGTASIQQPLIEPLYGGKSVLELSAMVAGAAVTKGHELVKQAWAAQWKLALHDGVVDGTKSAAVDAKADAVRVLAAAQAAMKPAAAMEVVFYPGAGPYDGRFSNNAWLQEAPDPMTKLVWDNAAMLSPATAKQLGVENGDLLALSANGKEIRMPAMVLPGHVDNSISVSLGYGRTNCGRVGVNVGHKAEALRTTAGFHAAAVTARKTGEKYELVTTQEHHTLEEPITGLKRTDIVIEAPIEEYRKEPHFIHAAKHGPEVADLFPGIDYSKGYQWGMAIDLNACVGCNACLLACVAENNIPVVGKDEVRRGREMHWIRMDRYFTGDQNDPQAVMQPMACLQCEKAPCESVCPVAATVHSPEGINEMAYNRCVGTRYCASNCPYKVRRFNFFNWNKEIPESRKMVFNPDVTVRFRGVMEKCNYCVQRIEEKRTLAKADNRRALKDGEVVTACQQVCPAEAIVFGNINDPASKVALAKKQPRDYIAVEELNTKPRTTYLAKLRNPNPELA